MTNENRKKQSEVVGDEETRAALILVVDDDVTVRSMAEHYLGAAGFRVLTLSEGGSVLETFQTSRPDAVLLDVMLPDADGFSICRELRNLPEAEHVPVAMLTSLNDEDSIRMAFEAGATEFLPKPLNWLHETYRLRYLLRASATMLDLAAAREALEQAKRGWEQTFDAIEDPVMLLSPDLTIVRANAAAARLGHIPIGELIGRQYDDVFAGDPTPGEKCPVRDALESKAPVQAELREYGPGKRSCLVAASPVLSGKDHVVAVVYSIKDVTEFRELEKELLHAQKMEALGVLAAGMAHDFNNLLQGIVGCAEQLSMEGKTQAEIQGGLDQIRSIAARGHDLTRQLLLTSRKGTSTFLPICIEPIVRETVELLARTMPKTIEMEVSASSDLWMNGEASHLQQAIINLAINSAHAMPEGGYLRISADNVVLDETYCGAHPECNSGPYALIAVSDTGCGIDKRTQERMYDPFFTTKGPREGSGLGLSVVYGIVRDHGGHICCYSDPGKGTTFNMYFPAVREESSQQIDMPEKKSSPPVSGEGKTVLLAEDEPLIQNLVQVFLSRHGYRVIEAFDGQQALELYQTPSHEFDAIILDMSMPRMGGERCLEELLKLGCEVPVVLMTGALLSADMQKHLLRYAARIIMKPFEQATLLEAITEVIAERSPDQARR